MRLFAVEELPSTAGIRISSADRRKSRQIRKMTVHRHLASSRHVYASPRAFSHDQDHEQACTVRCVARGLDQGLQMTGQSQVERLRRCAHGVAPSEIEFTPCKKFLLLANFLHSFSVAR